MPNGFRPSSFDTRHSIYLSGIAGNRFNVRLTGSTTISHLQQDYNSSGDKSEQLNKSFV